MSYSSKKFEEEKALANYYYELFKKEPRSEFARNLLETSIYHQKKSKKYLK